MSKRKQIDYGQEPKKLDLGEKKFDVGGDVVELYHFQDLFGDGWKVGKRMKGTWHYILNPSTMSCRCHKKRTPQNFQNLMWSEGKTVDEIAAWIVDNLASKYYASKPRLVRGCELDRAILNYYHRKASCMGFIIPCHDYCEFKINNEKGKKKFGVVEVEYNGFLRPLQNDEVVFVSEYPMLTFRFDNVSRDLYVNRDKMYWNQAYSKLEFFECADRVIPHVLSEIIEKYVGGLYALTFGELKYGVDYLFSEPLSFDITSVPFDFEGGEFVEGQCVADRIWPSLINSITSHGNELRIQIQNNI